MAERVILNPAVDEEMDRASVRARETFRYFWRELSWESRRIVPGLDLSLVKAKFEEPEIKGPNVEHMWVSEIACDGEVVVGKLVNQPNWLRKITKGATVVVPIAELEDWMYAQKGRVYGGFTVNLLRARMTPEERASHDKAWGLDFGDPEAIKLVPDWPPPGRGFFARMFGGPAPAPAGPDQEHPMSVNMRASFEQTLKKNPGMATSADKNGVTMLHQLAMAGSADGVEVLLRAGADRTARDNKGRTAADLAERMGWPRVVALLAG
jgi:uncharacterized protein YegJ (DUF2314 family)